MAVATERIRLYSPHVGQEPMHASAARFRIATCGRRFGKTLLCLNELAKFAWENPDTLSWWVAPTYAQARMAFRILTGHFRDAFASPPSIGELRCVWRSGSITQFKSADNYDALRGEGIHLLIGDEFASWPRAAWEEALRPTLSDTNGRAVLVGTPKGRNLFWELWCRGQDRDTWPDYESWQLPTAANPYIPASEIEEARRSLPSDVFRQEYEAQFLEDSAGVFRGIGTCEAGSYEEPVGHHQYVLGWDPAKHADASVVTVLNVNTRHVVAWDRWLQMDYTVQLGRVAALAQRYNAYVLMDSTGVGDPLLESLLAQGVPVEGYAFTNTTKQHLVEYLAVQIEQRTVTWPENPVLHAELAAFQYELTRAGNVRYNAPVGMHDDAVMSLALAVWAAKRGGGEVLIAGGTNAPRERVTWEGVR
jgi:phage terminase large subunit-like protein